MSLFRLNKKNSKKNKTRLQLIFISFLFLAGCSYGCSSSSDRDYDDESYEDSEHGEENLDEYNRDSVERVEVIEDVSEPEKIPEGDENALKPIGSVQPGDEFPDEVYGSEERGGPSSDLIDDTGDVELPDPVEGDIPEDVADPEEPMVGEEPPDYYEGVDEYDEDLEDLEAGP